MVPLAVSATMTPGRSYNLGLVFTLASIALSLDPTGTAGALC